MANRILTVQPLSRNEIPLLTALFEQSFTYYLEHEAASYPDYLRALRTLVGLGFAATLADNSLVVVYECYFDQFMRYHRGDFKQNQGEILALAQALAEMVSTAALSFKALSCPNYYVDFVSALKQTMAKIPHLLAASTDDVHTILRHFNAG